MSSAFSAIRDSARRLPAPLLGMALMLASTLAQSSMQSMVKDLVHSMSPFEIVFFRQLFGALLLGPILLRGGTAAFRTGRIGLHGVRAGLNVAAMTAHFAALGMIPLAQVTALNFTSPLIASVFAVLLLGERMRPARAVGLALGFAGALIVVRPGAAEVSAGALAMLSSAALWAATMTVIKILSRTESSLAITFYGALLQIPLALIPAILVWQTPSWGQIGLLVVISALGSLAQILLTEAFRVADVTVTLPLDFLKLIWASALGWFVFSELPDPFAWLGGAVIFAGVLWVARGERRAAPAKAAAR